MLVVPIDEKEFITTRLVRKMERAFLERLVRQGKLKNRWLKVSFKFWHYGEDLGYFGRIIQKKQCEIAGKVAGCAA